jgi:hypothetical protein
MSSKSASSSSRGRPQLFFDLNGTLCSLTTHRYANNNTVTVRPHIHRMRDLKAHFELIVFTSASAKNAMMMKTQVEKAGGFSFDGVLHRAHCDLVEEDKNSSGYATTKDVVRHAADVPRSLMIDDSPDKALDAQRANWLIVPPYLESLHDAVLPVLVDGLLGITDHDDLTASVEEMSKALFAVRVANEKDEDQKQQQA